MSNAPPNLPVARPTPLTEVAHLGLAVRALRQARGLSIDEFATQVGVSKQFVSDVERGKPTVQFGRVLTLCAYLGLTLQLSIPSMASTHLKVLQSEGVRPPRPRAVARSRPDAVQRLSLTMERPGEVSEQRMVEAVRTARTLRVVLPGSVKRALRLTTPEGGLRNKWTLEVPASGSVLGYRAVLEISKTTE